MSAKTINISQLEANTGQLDGVKQNPRDLTAKRWQDFTGQKYNELQDGN